jgi:hypothetical protein
VFGMRSSTFAALPAVPSNRIAPGFRITLPAKSAADGWTSVGGLRATAVRVSLRDVACSHGSGRGRSQPESA